MPLPPFQTDPRTQKLPPQLAVHPEGSPAVLLVTHPEELPAALKQHDKSVVIENTPNNARLKHDFERLVRWQADRLLIVSLIVVVIMQMVIANRYKLEADWHMKWKAIEMGGKITLTPSP